MKDVSEQPFLRNIFSTRIKVEINSRGSTHTLCLDLCSILELSKYERQPLRRFWVRQSESIQGIQVGDMRVIVGRVRKIVLVPDGPSSREVLVRS